MLKAEGTRRVKIAIFAMVIIAVAALAGWYLHGHTMSVLQPRGQIGQKERQLMIYAALLSLVVIVPVYTMTFLIVMKYRETNKKRGRYRPEFDHHRGIEFIWWAIPCLIIFALATLTWVSTHKLDPYKPIASNKKAMTIQVVSLDWKWLFIYPDKHIATVNFVEFPQNTPIDFQITSDTVMNSFWIPQLGGQIYAMPGMSTHLQLEASKSGDFNGSSANISGKGFAGMKFTAQAVSQTDFDTWANQASDTPQHLDLDTYAALAKPSENNPAATYQLSEPDLYNTIVHKYMSPHSDMPGMKM
jgi:cytochrome o ubiquinol oxidase subunit 2